MEITTATTATMTMATSSFSNKKGDINDMINSLPKEVQIKILVDYIGGWKCKKGKLVLDFEPIYNKIPNIKYELLSETHEITTEHGIDVFKYKTLKQWAIKLPIGKHKSYIIDYRENRTYTENEYSQEILVDTEDEFDFIPVVNPRGGSLFKMIMLRYVKPNQRDNIGDVLHVD